QFGNVTSRVLLKLAALGEVVAAREIQLKAPRLGAGQQVLWDQVFHEYLLISRTAPTLGAFVAGGVASLPALVRIRDSRLLGTLTTEISSSSAAFQCRPFGWASCSRPIKPMLTPDKVPSPISSHTCRACSVACDTSAVKRSSVSVA